MEDGDAAQFAAVPFGLVFMEFGIDRLQEGTHEGHFPRGTDDGALLPEVSHCVHPAGLAGVPDKKLRMVENHSL